MAPGFRCPSLPDGRLRRSHGLARGCKRTYLTFEAARWNRIRDSEHSRRHRETVADLARGGEVLDKGQQQLLDYAFNRVNIMNRRLPYERLGQLTVDILLGSQHGRMRDLMIAALLSGPAVAIFRPGWSDAAYR